MLNFCLPNDLLVFILVRLSLKSVGRFKSVSKPWNSLISSQEFVKLHLHLSSIISRIPNKLCYRDVYDKPKGLHFRYIQMAEISITTGKNLQLGWDFQRLYHPFESPGPEMESKIIGSCNGLLCQILYHKLNCFPPTLTLCNPLTKSTWVLPKRTSLFCNDDDRVAFYGFGYDDVHDDYKVMITSCTRGCGVYECEVYSLGSNTWSIVRSDLDFHRPVWNMDGVLVNCTLHWTSRDTDHPTYSDDQKHYIIAFDLRTDKHKILQLPEVLEKFNRRLELSVLNGCLLVYKDTKRFLSDQPDASFDLCVMKDYGFKDSWTRILIRYNLCSLSPVALLEDKQVIYFRCRSMIFLYDIASHQVLVFPLSDGCDIAQQRHEFFGSLVQPHPPSFRGSPEN